VKILQIDSDKEITDIFSKILFLKAHDYSSANNSKKAEQELLNNVYDLVLLDLTMPGFNGVQILDKLQKSNKRLDNLVIVLATLTDEEKNKIHSFGIKKIIHKPLSLTHVLEAINEFESQITPALGI